MKNVLLLKAGDAAAPIRLAAGDYDRWFLRAIGPGFRFHVVHAHLGEKLPARVTSYDAVIMTGSPRSVIAREPWMIRAGEFLREAGERRVPTLGVCFGHQLLAAAFGTPVVRHPAGREVGTVEIALTPEGRRDPLFAGVPERFWVQATHEDIVPTLPAGATLLAANGWCAVQAFAIGRYLRAVQFHPELDAAGMRAVIRSRAEALDREAVARGAPPGERLRTLLDGVRATPAGKTLLSNFLSRFT